MEVKVRVFWDFYTCPLPNGYDLSKFWTVLCRLLLTMNSKYVPDEEEMYLVGNMDTLSVLDALTEL